MGSIVQNAIVLAHAPHRDLLSGGEAVRADARQGRQGRSGLRARRVHARRAAASAGVTGKSPGGVQSRRTSSIGSEQPCAGKAGPRATTSRIAGWAAARRHGDRRRDRNDRHRRHRDALRRRSDAILISRRRRRRATARRRRAGRGARAVREGRAQGHRGRLDRRLQPRRPDLREAEARAVSADSVQSGCGAAQLGDGPVLLPRRPARSTSTCRSTSSSRTSTARPATSRSRT